MTTFCRDRSKGVICSLVYSSAAGGVVVVVVDDIGAISHLRLHALFTIVARTRSRGGVERDGTGGAAALRGAGQARDLSSWLIGKKKTKLQLEALSALIP